MLKYLLYALKYKITNIKYLLYFIFITHIKYLLYLLYTPPSPLARAEERMRGDKKEESMN